MSLTAVDATRGDLDDVANLNQVAVKGNFHISHALGFSLVDEAIIVGVLNEFNQRCAGGTWVLRVQVGHLRVHPGAVAAFGSAVAGGVHYPGRYRHGGAAGLRGKAGADESGCLVGGGDGYAIGHTIRGDLDFVAHIHLVAVEAHPDVGITHGFSLVDPAIVIRVLADFDNGGDTGIGGRGVNDNAVTAFCAAISRDIDNFCGDIQGGAIRRHGYARDDKAGAFIGCSEDKLGDNAVDVNTQLVTDADATAIERHLDVDRTDRLCFAEATIVVDVLDDFNSRCLAVVRDIGVDDQRHARPRGIAGRIGSCDVNDRRAIGQPLLGGHRPFAIRPDRSFDDFASGERHPDAGTGFPSAADGRGSVVGDAIALDATIRGRIKPGGQGWRRNVPQ